MSYHYRRAFVISLIATAAFVSGCVAGGSAESVSTTQPATRPAMQVSIDNFSFSPAELTIAVGDSVTWTNHDDVPHTVLSNKPDRTIKSDAMDTDQSYTQTFTKPGTYNYFCTIHPHMVGKVIVKPN